MRVVVAECGGLFDAPAPEVERIVGELRDAGHVPEHVRLPVGTHPSHTRLSVRLTDLTDAGEALVAVGGPAHLLRHPRKLVWCAPGAEGTLLTGAPDPADAAALAEAVEVLATEPGLREALAARHGVPVALAPAGSLSRRLA